MLAKQKRPNNRYVVYLTAGYADVRGFFFMLAKQWQWHYKKIRAHLRNLRNLRLINSLSFV
jgi:hypothetical protein